MAYKIEIGDLVIGVAGESAYTAIEPVLETAVGEAGHFSFKVFVGNTQNLGLFRIHGQTVNIYDGARQIWAGRIISTEYDFNKILTVTCEGPLAYLNDSVIPEHVREAGKTLKEYLTWIIGQHNAQMTDAARKFPVYVYPPDNSSLPPFSEDVDIEIMPARQLLDETLRELRCYPQIIQSGDTSFLSYAEYGKTIMSIILQDIRFGENLIDISTRIDGEQIKTVLVPVGPDGEVLPLTAPPLPGNPAGVYGTIRGMVRYDTDDMDEAQQQYTADCIRLSKPAVEIIAKAVDQSLIGTSSEYARVGFLVHVNSPPHGINQDLMVTRIRLDLDQPEQSEVTLGTPESAFTERSI